MVDGEVRNCKLVKPSAASRWVESSGGDDQNSRTVVMPKRKNYKKNLIFFSLRRFNSFENIAPSVDTQHSVIQSFYKFTKYKTIISIEKHIEIAYRSIRAPVVCLSGFQKIAIVRKCKPPRKADLIPIAGQQMFALFLTIILSNDLLCVWFTRCLIKIRVYVWFAWQPVETL